MIKIFAVFFASSLCVFAQTQMPSAKLIPDNSNAPQQSLQVPQQVAPTQNQAVEAEKIKAQKRKILKEKFFPEINPETEKIEENFLSKYKYYFILLAVILAITTFLVLRKKKQKPLTPYEIAQWQFNAIKSAFDKLQAKPYAEKTSQVVRDYINAVYNIPAPNRTTEEFLKIASNADVFDEVAKNSLAMILNLSDMAKFAQHAFNTNEKNAILEASITFVENDNTKKNQQNNSSEK